MIEAKLDYNSFDEETKRYINRVIDLYLMIKELKLNYYHDDIAESGNRELSRLDKKVYSFLMAIDSLDEKTRNPLDDYGGFDLDNICEFIKLDKKSVKKVKSSKERDYETIFEEEFSSVLRVYLNEYSSFGKIIQKIRPEVILAALSSEGRVYSEIVENYFKQHNRSWQSISLENPVYLALEAICEQKQYVTYKNENKINNNRDDNSNDSIDSILPPGLIFSTERTYPISGMKKLGEEPKENPNKKIDISDSAIWDYLEVLKSKFIGQEEFAEDMFYNLVNNIQLSRMKGVNAGRSIIFVDGPSGTGKTAITTDIAEKLGVPCVCSSITHYSSTGYVGGDLKDLLEQLYEKSDHNLNLAQKGIIILDEFDKIANNEDRDLRMKQAVQDQLLSLLGGEKYSLHMGMPLFGGRDIEFDTSKLTFVCLGAITNLREQKTSNKQSIGFSTIDRTEESGYMIKPEDLINMGLEKELVGRINTFLHTKDYSLEDLEKILRVSTISPMGGFKDWAEALGKKVIIDDEVYPLIAEKAYDLNTGARSLQTVMNSIRTRFLKTVLRGDESDIHLGTDDVNAAYAKTINRTKRG